MTIAELISHLQNAPHATFIVREDITLPPNEAQAYEDAVYVPPALFAALEKEYAYALN